MHYGETLVGFNGSVAGAPGAVGQARSPADLNWNLMEFLDGTVVLHLNQQEMELRAIIHTARSFKAQLARLWYLCYGTGEEKKHMFLCVCVCLCKGD